MKQTVIYQGLFLIALGLYGFEKTKSRPAPAPTEVIVKHTVDVGEDPEVAALYARLKAVPVFATPVDGVRMTESPRSIRISLISDELNQEGELAVENTWLPVLDQIGNALFKDGEPKVDVTFMSNAKTETNSFVFAAERADWVLRYLARKYQMKLDQRKYRVAGLGRTPGAEGKVIPEIDIVLKPIAED